MSVEFLQRPTGKVVELEGRFKMSDGFQLSYQRWSLGGATERIVLGLPGGGWYSGQFRGMGARLPIDVPGTELYAVDARGFGNSVEEGFQRGDVSSFKRLLRDTDEVAESLRGPIRARSSTFSDIASDACQLPRSPRIILILSMA